MRSFISAVLFAVIASGSAVWAQPAAAPPADRPKDALQSAEPAQPSVTTHAVTINGERVEYTATAGYIRVSDYEGKPKADVFYIAYVRLNAGGPETRPITFAFNGGPGSSSVWLHMGALGPKRVVMGDDEGAQPEPPARFVDNEYSWLDKTDLVFIDPVTTGYSRPVPGESAKQFHGYDEDIAWVGETIRLLTTRMQRWASPKYLCGESYGTTRAAGLTGYLEDEFGMYVNGIMLVSAVLDFSTIRFDIANDEPYWLYLPSYAATAWHHRRLAPELQADLESTLREVENFASTEYLVALAKGDRLAGPEREAIAAKLARYTGLSEEFILRSNLRIHISDFCKELLRDQNRTVGRLDSRYTGIDRLAVTQRPEYDPSLSAIMGVYTAAVNDYLRRELKVENDRLYDILTGKVQPWSYAASQNRYVNAAETLRSAMSQNPHLRVLVSSGYYDLATPYFATDYTIAHMGLDPSLRKNIRVEYHRSGHMMYVRMDDLRKLKADVAEFLQNR